MPPPLRCPSLLPSTACGKQLRSTAQSSRCFSTTSRNEVRMSRARRNMYYWLGTVGANFKTQLTKSTNYLSAYNRNGQLNRVVFAEADKKREEAAAMKAGRQPPRAPEEERDAGGNVVQTLPPETVRDLSPFPMNPNFISQPVLTSKFREHIWKLVMEEGKSVREVSAECRVEMSRVAAVVRLMEVEAEWRRINKPLAIRYTRAVQAMLPKTDYIDPESEEGIAAAASDSRPPAPHESINDLPVHAATGQQIFLPTSESRHFTREDAAKVFDEKLLPADKRIPHPELIVLHKEERARMRPDERARLAEAREAEEEKKRAKKLAKAQRLEDSVRKVDSGRWQFRISEIKVDDVGKDGKGIKATGWRYGVPLMDRTRGQIKIPQSVG